MNYDKRVSWLVLNSMMAIYLIDGNSYVYRAYYAIRGLTDLQGRPTNAIFGFTNMLMKIIRQRKPDAVVVAFDTPHPTERHTMYELYKANRPETPDDLIEQVPHIKRIIGALDIPIFELPGYEADDVLATLADEAVSHGMDAFIVTSDKDMMQLVTPHIKVYDPMKDIELDERAVEAKLGVPPSRVVEYMAIVGDASDNIPGVKGVGDKSARELLAEFGSLQEMFEHPQRIKRTSTHKKLVEGRDSMYLSLKLATINHNVPLQDLGAHTFKLGSPRWDELTGLFASHGFTSMIRMIPRASHAAATSTQNYSAIFEVSELATRLGGLKGEIAIDTETTSLDAMSAALVGFSICTERNSAYYVPLSHDAIEGQMPGVEAFLVALGPVLADPNIMKIGHNIKFDMLVLGAAVRGPIFDTMVASSLLDPNRTEHGLQGVALERLGRTKRSYKEVAGTGGFQSVSLEEATRYGAEDAELAFALKAELAPMIEEQGLNHAFYDIEMPLIPVLADMEAAGVKVSQEVLSVVGRELDLELEGLRGRIYFIAGGEFNINSPKQLAEVLFERLGLKPGKKNKTGYSTDVGVLEELSKVHELPAEVLAWRTLSKLKNTYVDVLPGLINPRTGRVHTSFNQASTATGRLSSSDPNLQNIPVRGKWGARIREAFIAEPGCVLISADYSQIELRILAHLSGDATLAEAFAGDADIHTRTAAEIFGVTPERVTSEMRRVAKTVNFGVVYGQTAYGLSEGLGISRAQADAYIKKYFERHPGVRAYIDGLIAEARKCGYVTTLAGRRRPVPELKSSNANIRQAGERLAVNTPVQGSAAEVIKLAMLTLHGRIREEHPEGRMILQVHDELLFEAPQREAAKFSEMVRAGMEGAVTLSVPLKVSLGVANNWALAH